MVLMMAVTVEGLVEYGRTLWEGAAAKEFQAVALQAAALALSVALCFAAGADFYRALGVNFSAPGSGRCSLAFLPAGGPTISATCWASSRAPGQHMMYIINLFIEQ